MKGFKKIGFLTIIQVICLVLAHILTLLIAVNDDEVSISINNFFSKYYLTYLKWILWFYVNIMILSNVFFSHRFSAGKTQELLFFFSSVIVMGQLLGFIFFCLIKAGFDFTKLDWFHYFKDVVEFNFTYYQISFLCSLVIVIFYVTFVDRRIIDFTKAGLRGQGKLKQVNSNLENSRWMNDEERQRLFKTWDYSNLAACKKDGIPVRAVLNKKGTDMSVSFNSPCHSIIIGSTGSGKTTTFVSPMIQLLGATNAGSSMIVTDPKGELFGLHSKFLKARGYDVKVIDLRDTYSSYRWNPLDSIWDNYQKYLNAYQEAYKRTDDPLESGLKLSGGEEVFEGISEWYEFYETAYPTYEKLTEAVKIFMKKTFDEVYEDLNDLVSVLIPVENQNDPMWEKGARSITLAVLLGMLEDSADDSLGMTKDKFNFFNMTKILQKSNNDYADLKKYFTGRSALSKAFSLSKQVCDCAESTRASYMSIVYEKLTMFNDAGICALTSTSDFSSEGLAERPTALFLKIPDEKDTRHNLAAIFILNIYKTLIKVASATEELTLDRNVYFIMDEFGNMPKIDKFDKFITVGRSRKIWFTMIIQSYAQLNNVYGETVADIVKGNCGIKMFIGSNDMGTCKEYSELCGNITVATESTSSSIHSTDVNMSIQTQVRPLIYPSDLQRLNKPGDIGHSIIVTFGNFPLKTYFSPSFKVPFYKMGKMDTSDTERYFDEKKVFYDAAVRNKIVKEKYMQKEAEAKEKEDKKAQILESMKNEETSETKAEQAEMEQAEEVLSEDQALLEMFKQFKLERPNGTLADFLNAAPNLMGGRKQGV